MPDNANDSDLQSLMQGVSMPEPTRSGEMSEFFQNVSEEGLGEVVKFAMGAASGLLENSKMPGGEALSGNSPAAGLGKVFGALIKGITSIGSKDQKESGGKGDQKEGPGADDKLVEKGATLGAQAALTSVGVPPPASIVVGGVIGKKVGEAYGQMKKEGGDNGKDQKGGGKPSLDPVGITKSVIGGIGDILKGIAADQGGKNKAGGADGKDDKKGAASAEDMQGSLEELIEKMMKALTESIGKLLGGGMSLAKGMGAGGSLAGGMDGGMDGGISKTVPLPGKGGSPMSSMAGKGAGAGLKPPMPKMGAGAEGGASKMSMQKKLKPQPPKG